MSDDPWADARLAWLTGQLTDATPIDRTYLSTRVYNILDCERIETVGQLALYGRARLSLLRGCGVTAIDEIRHYLRDRHGMELAP
jgi:DNA-directed RNA polymerase alpha subunit